MAQRTQQCNGERGQFFGLVLDYTENSTDVTTNTSNVTITGTIKATSTGYSYYGATSTGKLAIDGTEVTTGSSTATVDTSGVRLFSWTGNITHDDNGKKTARIKFTFDTTYGRLTETTMEFDWTLTEIPRASTLEIAATSIKISNTTGTIGYTVTSKGNFWHKLTWSIGELTTTVWTAQNINNASKTGTINYGSILDKMPTTTSGTLTVTVTTYTDAAATKQSGQNSATCSVTINTGAIKPAVSLGNISVNTPAGFTNLVAGHTTAKVTSTTTNSRGASAVTTRFTISKGSLTAPSTTAASYTATTATLPGSTGNYTFTITAEATDSRGVKSTAVTKTSPTVYAYATPTVSTSFYRVNANGDTTPDPAGEWIYIRFSAEQTYTVGGWNNTLTVTGKRDGSTVESGTWAQLADTSSSTLTVTVKDKVTTIERSTTIGTARFPLDLCDDTEGNVGVGIGMTADYNKIKANMPLIITNGTVTTSHKADGFYAGEDDRVIGTDSTQQDLLVDAPGRKIIIGKSNTTGVEITAPITANAKLASGKYLQSTDSGGSAFNMIGYNGSSLIIGGIKQTGTTVLYAGMGNDTVKVRVPNSAGTSSTQYDVFHKGNLTPEDCGFGGTLATTGLTYYNSRVTRIGGGYHKAGKMVFFSMLMRLNYVMGANDWWELIHGMPTPAFDQALTVAGIELKGTYNAWVNTDKKLCIATSSLALHEGDLIAITGYYWATT